MPACRRQGCALRRKSPRSIGARDFGEEGAEFGGIFFAGAGLDAAGCVHGIGVDGEDGLGDIFRSEAAGEKNRVFLGGAFGDFPIGETASATVVF